jgi:hypothetical protein
MAIFHDVAILINTWLGPRLDRDEVRSYVV